MAHTPTKKSVFDRIGGNTSSGTTNVSNKSTHGFCTAYVKSGTCPLGETCKYIHEQPNVDKQLGSKEEMRITKTITRVVDMSSPPIKSTVTVSNEQRPVVVSSSIQSTRTVVESVNTSSTEHLDRRSSGSDRKQPQSRSSDSKTKSSSKKKTQSSSHEHRPSSNKKLRSNETDSPVSSASDSEYAHSSHKHKRKSDSHPIPSKHKKHESISPNRDEEETLNDQLMRQSQIYTKSPKRTIVITERKKDENPKRSSKSSKSLPDIEFLGSKTINRDKKSIETIHQQTENPKKTIEVKREKRSPGKSSSSDQQRHHSSSTNTSSNEKNLQIKTEHPSSKTQNSSDRIASQSTPPVVQLSPAPELPDKGSVILPNETEEVTSVQPPSPICVILDDDSSPAPSIEKKIVRQTSEKKSIETEKNSSKQTKRSRDVDKNPPKDKSSERSETKRKRLNDGILLSHEKKQSPESNRDLSGSSRKITSSNKNGNENRSTGNRSDGRRSANTSSRDESSSRKYKDKSESKTSRNNDSKDRNSSSSKSRGNNDRRDTTRSSPEKKRSTYRRGKEKGLENITDTEEHLDEPVLPKQTALDAYMSMDWSLLSRDKRIPLNTQVTSRIVHSNNSVNACERLLTDEQKEKLNGLEYQSLPLTQFIKELQSKSTSEIVQSCQRRFGSCAKDMIDMRHKWFTRSIEPVQQYEFINKDHYIAFQQAINSLLDKTPADAPTVQIETTTADVLLS